MPQWTPRLLSPPSSTAETQSNMDSSFSSFLSATHRRAPSQLSEADVLHNAYNIPVLLSRDLGASDAQSTDEQRPPRHGRSMSHPFPSIFNRKKREGGSTAMAVETPTNEGLLSLGAQSPAKALPSKKTSKGNDRDLTTGKCMTCDSTVRWPKDLKVFRCTVCLTINDLLPLSSASRRATDDDASNGVHNFKSSSSKATPFSLKGTSDLIEKCISSYLLSRSHSGRDGCSARTYAAGSTASNPPWSSDNSEAFTEASDANVSLWGDDQHHQQPEYPLRPKIPTEKKGYQSIGVRTGSIYSSSGEPTSYSFEPPTRTPPRPPISSPSSRREGSGSMQQSHSQQEYKAVFKPLEEYLATTFKSHGSVNGSFSTQRPGPQPRAWSEGTSAHQSAIGVDRRLRTDDIISAMDEKTLLIGDFAENGAWWTGDREAPDLPDNPRSRKIHGAHESSPSDSVTSRSPRIDWGEVEEWYDLIVHAGRGWERVLHETLGAGLMRKGWPTSDEMHDLRIMFDEAQLHIRRVLLKATESLLKRPGGVLAQPGDLRFLLIILANPLLYPTSSKSGDISTTLPRQTQLRVPLGEKPSTGPSRPNEKAADTNGPGKHSGIIKRVLGLLSNLSNDCHHHLVAWFARLSEPQFRRMTELVGSFVTYRLTRQHGKRRAEDHDLTGGLIPTVSTTGHGSSAALHAALGRSGQTTKATSGKPKPVVYNDDWQIKAAARVMALLFAANNSGHARQSEPKRRPSADWSHSIVLAERDRAHRRGQLLTTSDFYNTLLDYSDLIADFEAWESKRGKFTFCQYPFFLSIWAKIQIMEHDARRQMEVKAREAFFDSIMTRKSVNQYLILRVRRDCLVEDSLKSVSEVVGSGGEEIKKGLRIEFRGEEGIDAGGLRKEWFLLLVRDVFNPEHGMFAYDDESQVCYFNPNSFETSDQFFLVGVVLGLAIYNSTILDVALPSFAFRKLLAAGPSALPGAPSHAKPTMVYTLEDLAEYRPTLARGLRQLLDYDGNVEETFCRDFVADVERYGQIQQVALCPDGEHRPVTNSNRKEFVDLYVKYLLDTAVIRQFEPFKRGFFTVCGGNALSLFRPDEIELLIRGSDEPLDISSLQAVAVYDNWGVSNPAETEPVIQWFWQTFKNAPPKDQRKLLSFITGSDRIPAMGAANLVIKLSCLGDDGMRFPVARTCFNMLSLWRYSFRHKLESMLWRAVNESEGFGLK